MDEIVGFVSEKTGLPEDAARTATEAVLAFLKDKLPPAVGSQLDQIANGGSATDVGGIAKSLGGLFGK